MKRSLAETLASNEPVVIERPVGHGQWERHELFTAAQRDQAIKAERDRIRSLAYTVGAYYTDTCDNEHCNHPHEVVRHFADLLEDQ